MNVFEIVLAVLVLVGVGIAFWAYRVLYGVLAIITLWSFYGKFIVIGLLCLVPIYLISLAIKENKEDIIIWLRKLGIN